MSLLMLPTLLKIFWPARSKARTGREWFLKTETFTGLRKGQVEPASYLLPIKIDDNKGGFVW